MTPTEIQNKRFDKSMSGYRMEDVQTYLLEVASHMQGLQDQNEDLQRKLEVLAEKVEQYREDEDSLRAALIGAQKLGDSVVRESKRKAEAIIQQATRKAEQMIAEAQDSITKESMALSKIQKEVSKFKRQIMTMYQEHLALIDRIPYDEKYIDEEPQPQKPQNEDRFAVKYEAQQPDIKEKVLETADEVMKTLDDEEEQISFAITDEENPDAIGVENPDAFPKRKSSLKLGGEDLGPLQFGPEFELNRNE